MNLSRKVFFNILFIHYTIASKLENGNILNLNNFLKVIENEVLGIEEFQQFVNNSMNFEIKKSNSTQIAFETSESISLRLYERMVALRYLKMTILDGHDYSFAYNYGNWKECCNLDSDDVLDKVFFHKINKDYMCTITSNTATHTDKLPNEKFLNAARNNFKSFPDIKWQYFGSDDGVLTRYPSVKEKSCNTSYDNRFRPWYVQATSLKPKDVVLVLDASASMNKNGKLESTELAAITVLETLTPNDRISVIAFSNEARILGYKQAGDECFQTDMVLATPRNIKILTKAVKEIKAKGETYYSKALKLSFDLLEKSFQNDVQNSEVLRNEMMLDKVAQSRDRLILFMSDGEPTDPPNEIFLTIFKRNLDLRNSVILLCYSLGKSTFGLALRRMASQDFDLSLQDLPKDSNYSSWMQYSSIQAPPPPTPGFFTHVTDVSHLRSAMANYYTLVSQRHLKDPQKLSKLQKMSSDVTWSVPYYDAGDLGMILTASSSIIVKDKLIGVVGIDVTMHELFADVSYFSSGSAVDVRYAFLLDSQGRVITHPLLQHPHMINDDPTITGIEAYERDPKVIEFISTTLKSVATLKNLATTVTLNDVITKTFSTNHVSKTWHNDVYKKTLMYSCVRVQYTQMLLCVVDSGQDYMLIGPQQIPYNFDFFYHRFDLKLPDEVMCQYHHQPALFNHSSIKFSPSSYKDTGYFVAVDETSQSISNYENIINDNQFQFARASRLKNAVWNDVISSWQLDRIWRESSEQAKELKVSWRYFGSHQGVFRVYPGVQLPKLYEVTQRPWFVKARSHLLHSLLFEESPEVALVFSAPYLDANQGKLVVSISKAIVSIKKDLPPFFFGVIGGDINLSDFHELMMKSFRQCNNYVSWIECIVIDSSGYVIYDKYLVNFDQTAHHLAEDSSYHITHKHPKLSQILMNKWILITTQCVDASKLTIKNRFEINSERASNVDLPFKFQQINQTNIFIISFNSDFESDLEEDCVLHDHISHPCVSSSSDIHCETPCTSSSTSHYNACTNKFYYSWLHDPPPCVPLPPDHHFVDHLKAGYYEKDQTKSFIMSNQLKPCQ